MEKIVKLRSELNRLRAELDFIEGQLDNDEILGGDLGLGELTDQQRGQLREQNEKLITEIIVLETLLEEV